MVGLKPAGEQVLDAGDWWVTIENTAGDVSVTNVITVASNERAVMTDFSIEDDYDTPAVTIADTTATAIMNVTFNKQYFGNLYLNEVDNETYTALKMVGGAAAVNLSTSANWTANLTKVTKSSDFTNKKATAAVAAGEKGIFFVDEDGTVSAKIKVPADVTRGTAYELIFDQTDVSSDDLGAKAEKENLNVTNSFVAPYVEGPAEIVVTKAAKGNLTPEITMYNEDGEVLSWWTAAQVTNTKITGFDSMKFYSIDSNTASASDTAATTQKVKIDDGVVTLTVNAAANDYSYAKFATTKGIFAAKSATLTSEVNEGAMAPMTNMTLAQDSTTPQSAKVTFKNLKGVAGGTVYIYQAKDGTDAANPGAIATYAHNKALGSAEVEGGATSVVIEDVFESVNATAYKNVFVAVFEPEDTTLFKSVYNGGDNSGDIDNPTVFTLKQKLTKYELVGSDDGATEVASKYTFIDEDEYSTTGAAGGTKAYLAAKDQFGDPILGNKTGISVTAKTMTCVSATFSGDAPAKVDGKFTLATTGAANKANLIVITDTNTTAMDGLKTLDDGNALSVDLSTKQTLTLTVDTKDTTSGHVKFKLSIS